MEVRMVKKAPAAQVVTPRSLHSSPRRSKPSSGPARSSWPSSDPASASRRRAPSTSSPRSIVEVERMFRAMVAERFPDHDVLAEELGGASTGARHRWVFDPLDGTTNYAHGLPIFCASLALEIDGQPEVAAVYDANRKELFTAERGVGAWLNGEPMKVSATRDDPRVAAGHGLPVHGAPDAGRATSRCSAPSSAPRARRPPARLGGDRSVLGGRGPHGRVLGGKPAAVGHHGGRR